MKNLNLIKLCGSLLLLAAIVLTSCSTSNDVVSNGLLQKRKYRQGYHLQDVFKKKKEQEQISSEVEAVAGHEAKIEEEQTGTLSELDQLISQLESLGANETTAEENRGEQELQTTADSDVHQLEQARMQQLSESHEAPEMKVERKKVRQVKKLLKTAAAYEETGKEGLISIIAGVGNFMLTAWIPLVGLAIGIIAIIYGLRAIKSSDETSRILGIIGTIFGALSIIYNLVVSLYFLFFFLVFAGTV